MSAYTSEITEKAKAELRAMPREIKREADERIMSLKNEPVPPDAETLPSKDPGKRPRYPLYRILVPKGPNASIYTAYRILYAVMDDKRLVSVRRILTPGQIIPREQ